MEQHIDRPADYPLEHELEHHEAPLSGWMCLALGVGFVLMLTALLFAIRLLG